MPDYVEYRVRPVVRYVVTRYRYSAVVDAAASDPLGEFDNVIAANEVAQVLASSAGAVCEPARHLKIGWLRGPGEPAERIRWELIDDNAPQPGGSTAP